MRGRAFRPCLFSFSLSSFFLFSYFGSCCLTFTLFSISSIQFSYPSYFLSFQHTIQSTAVAFSSSALLSTQVKNVPNVPSQAINRRAAKWICFRLVTHQRTNNSVDGKWRDDEWGWWLDHSGTMEREREMKRERDKPTHRQRWIYKKTQRVKYLDRHKINLIKSNQA